MNLKMQEDLNEFAHQLKIIIDSKIKCAELNMDKLISPYIPSVSSNHQTDSANKQSQSNIPSFVSAKLYNERMFELIEKHTVQICRLTYIRSKVNASNALKVNQLLETREYLSWEKKKLCSFFEEDI